MVGTIIRNSCLTPEEWKLSWQDKVREAGKKRPARKKEVQEAKGKRRACYEGYFFGERDFRLCRRQEYEIKGMSIGLYFQGHLEETKEGCRITGRFRKKPGANLFLLLGAVLCLAAAGKSFLTADYGILALSLGLFAVLLFCFWSKPKKGCKMILRQLERISTDEAYMGRGGWKDGAGAQ